MPHQGGTHDPHMKPGQKSGKGGNDKTRSASSMENKAPMKDTTRDKSMKGGQQGHKNKH
ncbi:hypothetical protein [Rhizobium sp. RM]|uniref:hypothetical protein n=1 Tax=Rhizobium sp. RM TaxID=2748079 RepID=UPI0015B60747|nr:hypothetical protein [Rhizobium sp. RM]NWJ23504.1 hypothetical protein [Rhizobium sp. RM]